MRKVRMLVLSLFGVRVEMTCHAQCVCPQEVFWEERRWSVHGAVSCLSAAAVE